MTIWRSGNGASYAPYRILDLPALIGRDDDGARARAALALGSARGPRRRPYPPARSSSIDDEAALAGRNLFALQGADGRWEIFSAARAELIGERSYRLSRLLRGLAGSRARGRAHGARRGAAGRARRGRRTADDEPRRISARPGATGSVPSGRDHADASVAEIVATVPARGAAAVCSRAGRGKARGGGHPPRLDPPHAPQRRRLGRHRRSARRRCGELRDRHPRAGAVLQDARERPALHPLCRCTGDSPISARRNPRSAFASRR